MLVEIMVRLIGRRMGAAAVIISPALALEKASMPRPLPSVKKKGINTQASKKEKANPRSIFRCKRVKFLR